MSIHSWLDGCDLVGKPSGDLLDVGSEDVCNLQWGHRTLSHRLREAGIAHAARENQGNHGGRMLER